MIMRMMSKCGKIKKVAHKPLDECVTDVPTMFSHLLYLLLNICTATWNLFVLYNTEVKRFITVTSFMHLSSNSSQIATNQNEHRINHILEIYILRLGFARFFFFFFYGNLKLVLQIDRD